MPNILILSQNELFSADLSDQIKHYSSDYDIIDKSSLNLADIIIIDDDEQELSLICKQEVKAPIFFLGTTNIKASPIKNIEKPLNLSSFLKISYSDW